MIRLIESLGNPDSTIILQKFYFNRSSKEIAKKLSMTSGAVRVRCSRALSRLEKLLANEGITLKEGF
jgi:RNA polymerase sigma-70 factor (ECF subfamily)